MGEVSLLLPLALTAVRLEKPRSKGEQMQPLRWQPPVEFSIQEEQIVRRIRKAKLFVFLRQYGHILFDEPFQEELANLYQKQARGRPPAAPAMLAAFAHPGSVHRCL